MHVFGSKNFFFSEASTLIVFEPLGQSAAELRCSGDKGNIEIVIGDGDRGSDTESRFYLVGKPLGK